MHGGDVGDSLHNTEGSEAKRVSLPITMYGDIIVAKVKRQSKLSELEVNDETRTACQFSFTNE